MWDDEGPSRRVVFLGSPLACWPVGVLDGGRLARPERGANAATFRRDWPSTPPCCTRPYTALRAQRQGLTLDPAHLSRVFAAAPPPPPAGWRRLPGRGGPLRRSPPECPLSCSSFCSAWRCAEPWLRPGPRGSANSAGSTGSTAPCGGSAARRRTRRRVSRYARGRDPPLGDVPGGRGTTGLDANPHGRLLGGDGAQFGAFGVSQSPSLVCFSGRSQQRIRCPRPPARSRCVRRQRRSAGRHPAGDPGRGQTCHRSSPSWRARSNGRRLPGPAAAARWRRPACRGAGSQVSA